MPSWQSRLLQLFIRVKMKRPITGNEEQLVAFARKNFGDKRLAARFTPKDVSLRIVNEDEIKGEWVWWEGESDSHVIFYLHGGADLAHGLPRSLRHPDRAFRFG